MNINELHDLTDEANRLNVSFEEVVNRKSLETPQPRKRSTAPTEDFDFPMLFLLVIEGVFLAVIIYGIIASKLGL